MTSGFDSFSLALFTTLSPSGVVAFVLAAIPLLFFSLETKERARLNRFLAIPYVIALIGFIASATHLGTPSNALHVFSGIGRSPLSNEVLAAVAFLFLGGSYWIISFKEDFPLGVSKFWLAVACTTGILFVVMTSLAYQVDTVLTWNDPFTSMNLLFSAFLAGPLITLFSFACIDFKPRRFKFILLATSCFALIVGSVLLFMHDASLATLSNDEMSALELVPDYFTMICTHVALGAVGIAVSAFSFKAGLPRKSAMILLAIACLFVLVAVFIPRIAFYAMHMTVGF